MFFLNLFYIYVLNPALGLLCVGFGRAAVDDAFVGVNSALVLLQVVSGTVLLCVDSYYVSRSSQGQTFLPNYCCICDLKVPVRTQHCLICGRCIAGYDHHCLYFNKCIGARNYGAFWSHLVVCCVQSAYFAGFSIAQLVFHRNARIVVSSALLLPVALFAALYSGYMITYHAYLVRKRLTTYQVICYADQQYKLGNFSDRERFAHKKFPFLSVRVAACLAAPLYREKKKIGKLQLRKQQDARPLKHLMKGAPLPII